MKTRLVKRCDFTAFGGGCSHKIQVKSTEGVWYDFSTKYPVDPQPWHKIITTEDGFKLALNPYNKIAYKIKGEKY